MGYTNDEFIIRIVYQIHNKHFTIKTTNASILSQIRHTFLKNHITKAIDKITT
jgi:hypothetical protein